MKKITTVLTAAALCAVLALSACNSNSAPAEGNSAPAESNAVSQAQESSQTDLFSQPNASTVESSTPPAEPSTPESSVQPSAPGVIFTEADCVGTWKFSVDSQDFAALLPALQNASGLGTSLSGSLSALDSESTGEFVSKLLNLLAIRMDADKKVYFRFDVTAMLTAISDMEIKMFDNMKNMTIEEAAAALGYSDGAESIKSMLEEQGLTWEEYLDAQKTQLEASMKAISSMTPEQIASSMFGDSAKVAEDGAIEIEYGTMSMDNGSIKLTPASGSSGTPMVLVPVDANTLSIDMLQSADTSLTEEAQQALAALKNIRLVRS